MTGCDKYSCSRKVKNKCTENDNEPNYTPPGIGFSFAMCHPPLSQEDGGFQLLVDSGSSKYFIDPELIYCVESKIGIHTDRISHGAMEIRAAGENVLRVTA